MEIKEFIYPEVPKIEGDITVCLGYFDGIHLGHKAIIEKARNEGYKVAVLTFDNSPAYILGKAAAYFNLTSIADKAEFLSKLDVDYLLLMHFDMETTKVTKDEFINNILKPLNPKKIFCGEDYRFGARGEGDPTYLSMFFDVDALSLIKQDDIKISSRNIVALIKQHEVAKAKGLLGRPYRVNGLVVEGNHNGHKLEFPTANLKLDYPYVFPDYGVYMGYAEVDYQKYKAIINVGVHPTVGELVNPIIEVHIIDFEGNIYGKDIFVEFIDYLREEKKFDSFEELKKQLEKDKKKAKNALQD